jgi:multiple sugar transport system ATP-binding protein
VAPITLEHIEKRYPDGALAVEDFNLEIADGEFVILVGPSGSGKSTVLNMIAGLEDITAGELLIGGQVVNQKSPKDRDIAMVFQSYALYPHMTVRENMGFALKLAKTPKDVINQKVEEAARILDLTQHLDRKPANLSGGQRQRVAMGRAIVRDPAAFLMDEPLSNLDAKLRVQTRTEVSRLQRRLGTTMVYVTHDQTEALTLGDRVAVIRGGRLQQVAPPQELYDRPVNLFVAGFIGSPAMNFMSGALEDGKGRDRGYPAGELRGRVAGARREPAQRDHVPGHHRCGGVAGVGEVRLLQQGARHGGDRRAGRAGPGCRAGRGRRDRGDGGGPARPGYPDHRRAGHRAVGGRPGRARVRPGHRAEPHAG